MAKMKAAIFVEKNRIVLDDKDIPEIGPLDALVRITTTTLCGTDVHILRGEYPVAKGLTTMAPPVTKPTPANSRPLPMALPAAEAVWTVLTRPEVSKPAPETA